MSGRFGWQGLSSAEITFWGKEARYSCFRTLRCRAAYGSIVFLSYACSDAPYGGGLSRQKSGLPLGKF